MFCPRCGYEYREGFGECADCKVPLVRERPSGGEAEYAEYKQVLFTYNPFDVAMIKSILDAEEIDYYFLGEHLVYLPLMAEPARLMVRAGQAEEARAILEDLKLSILASSGEQEEDEEPG
jgi:hypothetical protein